jgi:putative DNA primase/helicase
MLNETGEGGILDSETVKSITSSDLRADRAHAQANQQYRVTGKIHLVTNHLPHITPDAAMRRRIVVIPWTQSFADNPDPNLEKKLMGELPGILAWLVQGAQRWYADFSTQGLKALAPPPLCAAELDRFFEEEDEVGAWMEERVMTLGLDTDPRGWTPVKDLFADYVGWRFQQGMQGQPVSTNAFGRRLSGKGYDGKTVRVGTGTAKVRPLKLNSSLIAGLDI